MLLVFETRSGKLTTKNLPSLPLSSLLFLSLSFTLSAQIREDIRYHGINIYPSAYGAEDEEDAATNAKVEVSCVLLSLGEKLNMVLSCIVLFIETVCLPV